MIKVGDKVRIVSKGNSVTFDKVSRMSMGGEVIHTQLHWDYEMDILGRWCSIHKIADSIHGSRPASVLEAVDEPITEDKEIKQEAIQQRIIRLEGMTLPMADQELSDAMEAGFIIKQISACNNADGYDVCWVFLEKYS